MIDLLTQDRCLAVVRAPRIDDPVALADALAVGGIRVVELTFTTPGVTDLLRAAVDAGAFVGCGTVLSTEQAEQAVLAGARFLVTPGLGPDAAAIVATAHAAGVPVMLGALTPSEVMTAVALGADVVKIFPARTVGPRHLADLHGPLPDVALVPSGGVDASNAADYLAAGALAVTAGTSVVSGDDVVHGRWSAITSKATDFVAALGKVTA
ncbi:bifunctional 4-hydroxy-2-oxoglutarate aldolase/2-dehydro-3-deoxy-phosphogluconate aldolase [Nocardioides mangrovicus]|uniref:Bifunctional 4-hydroxy-2-oxoglutarate aldolase/2-dehydro-3-deoxy-phosphogluconate aldolase n=1 Tax=Nocardioides mangrovicus TaxID=2478913 RepID=A0A3L8P474_9ACTN|nr:bifunctional 4-hydroxy-2-oxoglutarate aldolase/2-dehydro-3-deoxy-phosphogluconate aldolase [Nocardioides mangrovicus]RLV49852.1 bifunctional 4-hydroxy-2-oxoglutarate aldolase/2-dehydro-3-deoxy-phosphogluconate aldolase [Nocardioides mangrovicus]